MLQGKEQESEVGLENLRAFIDEDMSSADIIEPICKIFGITPKELLAGV